MFRSLMTVFNSLRAGIPALCAVFFLAGTLNAQVNTSTIAGAVIHETGATVPNAKVMATLLATGQQRETTTGNSGEFVLPQMAPGIYRVSVTAAGFQTAIVENLNLTIAERAVVNINLKLGQVSEQITVEATGTLLEQETASLGQVITRKAINDLPLNGRNYLSLGSLSPGVIPQLPTGTGPSSFIAATTQRSDCSLLVGGQRESSTSYLYDGV